MEKYRELNRLRRRIMHALTGGLKSADNLRPEASSIKRILITRPNGRLGNMLLLTPLVREIHSAFPTAQLDLFVKGPQAAKVFSEYPQIRQIIALPDRPFSNPIRYMWQWLKLRSGRYDLIFNADPRSSSGRLSTKVARGSFRIFGENNSEIANRYPDAQHMAKNPVLRFREFLAASALAPRNARLPELSLCLTREELENGGGKIEDLVRNSSQVVGLFTYATGSKDFGKEWWRETLLTLKREFPTVNFIELLPLHGASAIDYRTPSVYSRNIRELGAIAAGCKAFICADCGVMHLASAAGVPVIGLFKVTKKEKYAPYNRQSIGMDMNRQSVDDIIRHLRRILGPKAVLNPGKALMGELAN